MVFKKLGQSISIFFAVALWAGPQFAFAQTSCGNSYCIDEVFMGPGGSNDVNSPNFTGRGSVGDTALPINNQGIATGTDEQSTGGNTSSATPELEVTLSAVNIDMGVFSPSAASTGTATFSVRSYLSSGYVVYTYGVPPSTTGGAQIDPMTTGGTSTPGTEQFGINLVDNSNPDVGANVTQGEFGVGFAANNYNTANNFRYNVGDAIARSDSSSGITNYTISYLVNVHPVTTPAGKYTFTQSIVVTPTF